MQIPHKVVKSLGDAISEKKIVDDVEGALSSVRTRGEKFIVNDTEWFWLNPAGDVRPTVVNSASFISRKFQAELKRRGWKPEWTSHGQNIDAFTQVRAEAFLYFLPKERFLPVLQQGMKIDERISRSAHRIFTEDT